MLLLGLLLGSAVGFAYAVEPNEFSCGAVRLGTGLAYALIYASLLVKLKKGTITSSELILLDREDKRNLKLTTRGKVVTEDTVDTGDKVESEKRATHLAEKIEKMKNSNFKVSATRILLKNINKALDEEGLKTFVKEKLVGTLTPKELKSKKVLKNVRILRDEQKDNRSKVG